MFEADHVPAPSLLDASLLAQAVEFVRTRRACAPRLAVILDSGSDSFAEQLQKTQNIFTTEISGYPLSTVSGNTGRWIFGNLAGKNILVVQGGAHTYEGHTAAQVGFVVHLLAELGVQRLIVTNAASGLNPNLVPGDLMLIDDHINMMFVNPLRGQHRKAWGERWPDLHAPYDPALQKLILQVALARRIPLQRGVLLATRGPSYETAAEVHMARCFGADAVTRSIVPEVLVAVSRRMQVLGLSCITNMATGLSPQRLDHVEAAATVQRMSIILAQLLTEIIKRAG